MKTARWGLAIVAVGLAMSSLTALAASGDYSAWSQAVRVESIPGTHPDFNGVALDGCPFVSRDGRTFYMASTRSGGLGGIDIWVSTRASADDPWGEPATWARPSTRLPTTSAPRSRGTGTSSTSSEPRRWLRARRHLHDATQARRLGSPSRTSAAR